MEHPMSMIMSDGVIVPDSMGSNSYGFEHDYNTFKNNYRYYNPDRPFTQFLYNIMQFLMCK